MELIINNGVSRELVLDRGLGKTRPMAERPVLSSGHLDWKGVLLERHRMPRYESREIMWINHVVALSLGRPCTVECRDERGSARLEMKPGAISIRPSHAVSSCRTEEPVEFVTVSLTPEFLMVACCDLFKTDDLTLQSKTGIEDPYIDSVCRTLLQEVEREGRSGRLYAESLATSLAVHLVSQHGGTRPLPLPGGGGLSGPQLKRVAEFIHHHIFEDITLRQMADTAGLSPFHFARQFKKSMGFSPYQFVLRQRIERSKQMLIQGEKTLADIALEVGFYDQSHFAQQFKRLTGMTPRFFARQCGCRTVRPR